jgi:hypothetical protein
MFVAAPMTAWNTNIFSPRSVDDVYSFHCVTISPSSSTSRQMSHTIGRTSIVRSRRRPPPPPPIKVGNFVGLFVGAVVGAVVGMDVVGDALKAAVGAAVGTEVVGESEGAEVGLHVGAVVGAAVGDTVAVRRIACVQPLVSSQSALH